MGNKDDSFIESFINKPSKVKIERGFWPNTEKIFFQWFSSTFLNQWFKVKNELFGKLNSHFKFGCSLFTVYGKSLFIYELIMWFKVKN